jgi:hypothetical protein
LEKFKVVPIDKYKLLKRSPQDFSVGANGGSPLLISVAKIFEFGMRKAIALAIAFLIISSYDQTTASGQI